MFTASFGCRSSMIGLMFKYALTLDRNICFSVVVLQLLKNLTKTMWRWCFSIELFFLPSGIRTTYLDGPIFLHSFYICTAISVSRGTPGESS